jgi:hypothetical protein
MPETTTRDAAEQQRRPTVLMRVCDETAAE